MGTPTCTFTDRQIEKPIAAPVSNLKVIPLHHLLLVRVNPEEDVRGLVIIPQAHAASLVKHRTATVIRTGPGFRRPDESIVEMRCKPGDTVVIRRDRGTEVEQQGERLLLINQDEVLCILD